jgi:hypothetical protein
MPTTSALAPFVGRPGLGISVTSGLLFVGNSIFALNGGFVPCVANSLNYVYLTLSPTVALAANQSGFPTSNALPIGLALTDNNSVKDLVDYRPDWYLSSVGSASTATVANPTLPNQSGSIGTTTLYSVPAGNAGMYAVYADVIVTTPAAAGSVQVNVSWNNGTTSAGLNSAPFSLAATGEQAALVGSFFSAGSQNITFSTTVAGVSGGPPAYQLSLRLVFLG